MRGRVAGRLVDLPRPEVGVDRRRPSTRSRSGSTTPAMPVALAAARARRSRRSGSSGTPLWRATSTRRASAASGSLRRARHVPVVGVHPQLAAGALDDRGRLAVVVGVRVGADEQADVLEAQVDLGQRALEVGERARARACRSRTARCRRRRRPPTRCSAGRPGHGQRQAQAPHAGEDALAAAELALAGGSRAQGAAVTLVDVRDHRRTEAARSGRQGDDGQGRPALLRRRSPRATSTRWSRAGSRAAIDRLAAQGDLIAPDGVRARTSPSCSRAIPDFALRGPVEHAPRTTAARVRWTRHRHVRRRRARSTGIAPNGRAHRHRGHATWSPSRTA